MLTFGLSETIGSRSSILLQAMIKIAGQVLGADQFDGYGWVSGSLFLPFNADAHFMANYPILRQKQGGWNRLLHVVLQFGNMVPGVHELTSCIRLLHKKAESTGGSKLQ